MVNNHNKLTTFKSICLRVCLIDVLNILSLSLSFCLFFAHIFSHCLSLLHTHSLSLYIFLTSPHSLTLYLSHFYTIHLVQTFCSVNSFISLRISLSLDLSTWKFCFLLTISDPRQFGFTRQKSTNALVSNFAFL